MTRLEICMKRNKEHAARIRELEAVVRDLADSDPWSDNFRCRYCNTHALDSHAEDCLRRRADELMKGR